MANGRVCDVRAHIEGGYKCSFGTEVVDHTDADRLLQSSPTSDCGSVAVNEAISEVEYEIFKDDGVFATKPRLYYSHIANDLEQMEEKRVCEFFFSLESGKAIDIMSEMSNVKLALILNEMDREDRAKCIMAAGDVEEDAGVWQGGLSVVFAGMQTSRAAGLLSDLVPEEASRMLAACADHVVCEILIEIMLNDRIAQVSVLLTDLERERAGGIMQGMPPYMARDVLAEMQTDVASDIVAGNEISWSSSVLGGMEPQQVATIFECIEDDIAAQVLHGWTAYDLTQLLRAMSCTKAVRILSRLCCCSVVVGVDEDEDTNEVDSYGHPVGSSGSDVRRKAHSKVAQILTEMNAMEKQVELASVAEMGHDEMCITTWRVCTDLGSEHVAMVLGHMACQGAGSIVSNLDPSKAAEILARMSVDKAADVLIQVSDQRSLLEILKALQKRQCQFLATLIRSKNFVNARCGEVTLEDGVQPKLAPLDHAHGRIPTTKVASSLRVLSMDEYCAEGQPPQKRRRKVGFLAARLHLQDQVWLRAAEGLDFPCQREQAPDITIKACEAVTEASFFIRVPNVDEDEAERRRAQKQRVVEAPFDAHEEILLIASAGA